VTSGVLPAVCCFLEAKQNTTIKKLFRVKLVRNQPALRFAVFYVSAVLGNPSQVPKLSLLFGGSSMLWRFAAAWPVVASDLTLIRNHQLLSLARLASLWK
jgi:hypothetical protein